MEPTVEWPDDWVAASPTCFSLCAVYAAVLHLNDWQSRLGREQYRVSIVSPGNPFISINFSKLFFLQDDAPFFSGSSHSHVLSHVFTKLWEMDQRFNLQIITVHTKLFNHDHAQMYTKHDHAVHVNSDKNTHIFHIKHTQTLS